MKDLETLLSTSENSSYCVLSYYEKNLGDHIQTLALLHHLRPRAFVMRDHLTTEKDLCLVANGWLSHGEIPKKENFQEIRYVGIHLDPKLRTDETVEKLRDCGVVGCRDSSTKAYLDSKGILTHLCGCATLTFPEYHGRREGIYGVDLKGDIKEWVLSRYRDSINLVTHHCENEAFDNVTEGMVRSQYEQAYALLERYQKAELVITTRLHATLPCIAFGTPVIYVGVSKKFDDRLTAFNGIGVRQVHWRTLKWIPWIALHKPLPVDAAPFKQRYMDWLRQNVAPITTC